MTRAVERARGVDGVVRQISHAAISRREVSAIVRFLKRSSRTVRLVRSHASFSLAVASALMVAFTNVSQGKEAPGFLMGYFSGDFASSEATASEAAQTTGREHLALVPLATASSVVDPGTLLSDEGTAFRNPAALVAREGEDITRDPEEDDGVKLYTVKEGDSLTAIAGEYDINVNTILWANDIANADDIKPGDQIFILPVAGVSHTVADGETLDAVAAKYKADKAQIIAFNDLSADGAIETGKSLIVPGGIKEGADDTEDGGDLGSRRRYATAGGDEEAVDISQFGRPVEGKAGSGHRFPYGYCTWYVAQKRYVPWRGNAGTWLYNAKALGYKTGKTPAPGAIVVTTENRFYGHVALVEKVSSDSITVSEMNYRGWGKTNKRVIPLASRAIRGYIY